MKCSSKINLLKNGKISEPLTIKRLCKVYRFLLAIIPLYFLNLKYIIYISRHLFCVLSRNSKNGNVYRLTAEPAPNLRPIRKGERKNVGEHTDNVELYVINTILILYTFFDSDFSLTRTTNISCLVPAFSKNTYQRLQWLTL